MSISAAVSNPFSSLWGQTQDFLFQDSPYMPPLPELWVDGRWNCAVSSEELTRFVYHRDWEQRFKAVLHPNATRTHKEVLALDMNNIVRGAVTLLCVSTEHPNYPVEWVEAVTGVPQTVFRDEITKMMLSSMIRFSEPYDFYDIMMTFFPQFLPDVKPLLTGGYYDQFWGAVIRRSDHV